MGQKDSLFKVAYVAGGKFDPPFMPTKIEPYIKGLMLIVNESIGLYTKSFTLTEDMELLSVAVGASEYQIFDYWDVIIDGKIVIDSIFTKDLPEGIYLMVAKEVKVGSTIEFVFHNDSGTKKYVWINYQFLKD